MKDLHLYFMFKFLCETVRTCIYENKFHSYKPNNFFFTDTKSGFTDDVRMPELDEVIKKQLPLMDDRLLHLKKTNQGTPQLSLQWFINFCQFEFELNFLLLYFFYSVHLL